MLKLSKTGISILKKQYQSVLFKCFLIATGLFVAMSPNFANAVNLTITTGENVNPTSGIHEGNGYNYDTINVSDGTLILDPSQENPDAAHVRVTANGGMSSISGGTINMEGHDAKIKTHSTVNNHTMNVSGGQINMADGSKFTITTVNVSGDAEINLDDAKFGADRLLTISGGTINMASGNIFGGSGMNITGGQINMTGDDIIGMDTDEGFHFTKFTMSDGIIDVNGGIALERNSETGYYNVDGANIIFSNDMNVSGGLINVNADAHLWLSSDFTTDGYNQEAETPNVTSVTRGTINLTGEGKIYLKGDLTANVKGNGYVTFYNGGILNGNISGATLIFNNDTILGNSITGNIGDLDYIMVHSGVSLTMDKKVGKINCIVFDGSDVENLPNLTIGNGVVLAPLDMGGTLDNLNVSGTFNIGTAELNANNVTFDNNSSLGIHVTSEEEFGKIVATSEITATEGAKLNVTFDNGILARDETMEIEVLQTEGTLENEFAEISKNSRYSVEWVKEGEENTGTLLVTGIATPSDIVKESGGTENNAKTAEAWDNINLTSDVSEKAKEVASIINTLSQNAVDDAGKKAYTDALTALAPDSAPSISKTSSETANQIFSAVGTRLSGGSISSTTKQGTSAGDAFENVAIWAQGLFNKAKLDKNSTGFDSKSYGIALGIEKNITDEVKVGLGYAYSTSDIDGYLRSTDVDTNSIIAYADYNRNNWYINGILSFGFSGYEENKNVAGTSVKGKWDVNSLGAQLMTGYNIKISDYGITPEIGFRYVHIDQDSYTDTADQKIKSHKGNIFTGVVGSKFNKEFNFNNGLNLIPEVRLALTYDFKQDDGDSIITLANGSSYSVDGEPLDKFGVELGLGVTSNITDTMELTIGYEGKFVKDYTDHTGLINFKYKF